MAQAFDTAELDAIRGLEYSEADVRFMRGMIPHHGQALDMTAMVPARATTDGFSGLALRMQISQRDEIRLMERWLAEREEKIPATNAHRMMMAGDMALMPGMLNAGQMEQLTWTQVTMMVLEGASTTLMLTKKIGMMLFFSKKL